MATTAFNVSPTAGTGTTQVSVTPTSVNGNTYDLKAIGTITDGRTIRGFTINHYGVPSITQWGSSEYAPYTGAELHYTVTTHYPIVFRSVPDWVRIKDNNGTYYTEGQQIPSGSTLSRYFHIEVLPNSGSARQTTTFNMGHYLRGSLANRVSYIHIEQAAYSSAGTHTVDISHTRSAVGSEGGTREIYVTSDDNWAFYDVPSYITIFDENWNQQSSTQMYTGTGFEQKFYWTWASYSGSTEREVSPTIVWDGSNYASSLFPITQYPYVLLPYIQLGDYLVPASGGTKEVLVDSDLPWWWYDNGQVWNGTTNIPSWITIRDENGNIMSGLTSQRKNTYQGGSRYYFTFAPNSGANRSYTPAIYYDRDSNTVSSATASYQYVQSGTSSGGNGPTLSPNRIEFPQNSQEGDQSTDYFVLTSNSDWDVVTSGDFSLIPSYGTAGTHNLIAEYDGIEASYAITSQIEIRNYNGSTFITAIKGGCPTINGSSADTSTQVIAGGSSTVTFNFHTDYDKTEVQFYSYGSWPTGITVTSDLGTYTDLGSGTYIGILETEWERDGYFSVNIPINVTGGQRRIVGIVYYYPNTNEEAHYSGPTFTIFQDD